MSRKPTTQPEQRHGGRHGHGQENPTFRPIGPVASDEGRDWIRMREAIMLLRAAMPKRHAAERWMLENLRAGLVPITCRLLTYERSSGGGTERVRYEWPGVEARLCEQIDQAVRHGLSGFDMNGATCDLSWLDVTGLYSVETKMFDTHVDRAAVTAATSIPETKAQLHPAKPFDKDTPHAELVEWYCARRDAAPAGGYTRDEDVREAKEVGIGRDTVRDLRKEHAPANWRRSVPKDKRT